MLFGASKSEYLLTIPAGDLQGKHQLDLWHFQINHKFEKYSQESLQVVSEHHFSLKKFLKMFLLFKRYIINIDQWFWELWA